MIIAVSSQGNNLESQVDPRFGRTQYFILYDTSDDSFQVLDNTQNVAAAQGAGVQASQSVVSNKAEVVVSGSIGPRAYQTLTAAGIKIMNWGEGTVSQAIEMVKNNQLKPADDANVQGHWM